MKNSGFVVLAERSISVSLTIFSGITEEDKSQSHAGNTYWLKDRAKRLVSEELLLHLHLLHYLDLL